MPLLHRTAQMTISVTFVKGSHELVGGEPDTRIEPLLADPGVIMIGDVTCGDQEHFCFRAAGQGGGGGAPK